MREMKARSIYVGSTSVQMLLEVMVLDEITQLVKEDREEERLGSEKDLAEESKKRPEKRESQERGSLGAMLL